MRIISGANNPLANKKQDEILDLLYKFVLSILQKYISIQSV